MRWNHIIQLIEAEETPDDLFRKINSLQAIIDDKSSSQGEKNNAKTLKGKLEAKLKSKFPNAKPSPQPSSQQQTDQPRPFDSEWWKEMADYLEQEKHFKENPEAAKKHYQEKLDKLLKKRKMVIQQRLAGDVEDQEYINELTYEIERIMKEWFPEKYEALLKKREEQSKRSVAKASKERQIRNSEFVKKIRRSGLKTFREAGIEYNDLLKTLHDKILETKLVPYMKAFTTGKRTLEYMLQLPTGKLREIFMSFDETTLNKFKEIINSIHTLGYGDGVHSGFTVAQKTKILDTMRPSKTKTQGEEKTKELHDQGLITKDEFLANPEAITLLKKLEPLRPQWLLDRYKSEENFYANNPEFEKPSIKELEKTKLRDLLNHFARFTQSKEADKLAAQVKELMDENDRRRLYDMIQTIAVNKTDWNKTQQKVWAKILGFTI